MAKVRKDFKEDLKWNVKDLYNTEEEYEKDYHSIQEHLKDYAKYQGHILDSENTLYEVLSFDYKMSEMLERIYVYAHINNDSDTTDVKYQTMFGKAYKLYEEYNEATSFLVPEILKGSWELIEEYVGINPKLKPYERVLKNIFRMKKYVLSDKEEKILSSLSTTFSTPDNVYSYLTDADMKFGTIKDQFGKKHELNERTYHEFIESNDREMRKQAFTKLLSTYGDFKNAYASLLASEVNNNNKVAQIRGYKSAREASLYGNEIPVSIYDNLISTVKKNIAPLSKFWKIKKEALGVSKLHLYDTYTALTNTNTKKYTEKESEELLYQA